MNLPSRSRLARGLFALLLKGLSRTWRMRGTPPDDDVPRVIAFRHGAMLPIWYHFRGGGSGGVVSRSDDGDVLAHYLEALGYIDIIRGSSSEGGKEVLHRMIALLQRKSCLITPDGPRGPAGVTKPGAAVASVRSGRELLLMDWTAHRSKRLGSWDAMEIPFPFTRIECRYCIVDPKKLIESIQTEHSIGERTEWSIGVKKVESKDDGVDTSAEKYGETTGEKRVQSTDESEDVTELKDEMSTGVSEDLADVKREKLIDESEEMIGMKSEGTTGVKSEKSTDESEVSPVRRSDDLELNSASDADSEISEWIRKPESMMLLDEDQRSDPLNVEPKRIERLLVRKIIALADAFMAQTNRRDPQ